MFSFLKKRKTTWKHKRCWNRENVIHFLNSREGLKILKMNIASTPITAPIEIGGTVPRNGVQFDIYYQVEV